MAMKKVFYTVTGEIIAEKATESTRVDYLTDALGSVTATVNQSAQVVNTYRYKPYGTQLAKTGTAPDPSFGWVGTKGYRPTQQKFSDFYVRARHYSEEVGRWTTKDPIDRLHYPYRYGLSNPGLLSDPSGLLPLKGGSLFRLVLPLALHQSILFVTYLEILILIGAGQYQRLTQIYSVTNNIQSIRIAGDIVSVDAYRVISSFLEMQ